MDPLTAVHDADPRLAGAVLADAFLEDPVMRWLVRVPDERRRLLRLRHLMTSFALTAARTPGARLLVARRLQGRAAALWLPPGAWRPGALEQVRSLPRGLLAVRSGAVRALRTEAAVHAAHPQEPHWFLHALGAERSAQGSGVGGLVVQPVLDRCDADALPAYLESSNPRNHSFYRRHGFTSGPALDLPRGCPPVVPFWRAPR